MEWTSYISGSKYTSHGTLPVFTLPPGINTTNKFFIKKIQAETASSNKYNIYNF